jgi:hypothetical protein
VIVGCKLVSLFDRVTFFGAGLGNVASFVLRVAKVVHNVLKVQASAVTIEKGVKCQNNDQEGWKASVRNLKHLEQH